MPSTSIVDIYFVICLTSQEEIARQPPDGTPTKSLLPPIPDSVDNNALENSQEEIDCNFSTRWYTTILLNRPDNVDNHKLEMEIIHKEIDIKTNRTS